MIIQTTSQLTCTIIIVALATLLTRALPFWLFPAGKETPPLMRYLSSVLPFAVIGMLVVYCFKNVSVTAAPFALPELIAAVFVIAVHHWKHNMLLSIVGGTLLYMVLVQRIF